MKTPDFESPALTQVRQVRAALPGLGIDFGQAEAAIQELGTQARGRLTRPGVLGLDTLPLEVVHLFPERSPLVELRQSLEENAPQPTVPRFDQLPARDLQVFQLLALLFTRHLHLGDVLLHVLDPEGDHPRLAPRPELAAEVGWLHAVRSQHVLVRRSLLWMLGLREGSCRWIRFDRIPVHLGWTRTRDALLVDLLNGQQPLYLHQLFALLLWMEVPMREFVRHLYFMDALTLGGSVVQLQALDSPRVPVLAGTSAQVGDGEAG